MTLAYEGGDMVYVRTPEIAPESTFEIWQRREILEVDVVLDIQTSDGALSECYEATAWHVLTGTEPHFNTEYPLAAVSLELSELNGSVELSSTMGEVGPSMFFITYFAPDGPHGLIEGQLWDHYDPFPIIARWQRQPPGAVGLSPQGTAVVTESCRAASTIRSQWQLSLCPLNRTRITRRTMPCDPLELPLNCMKVQKVSFIAV